MSQPEGPDHNRRRRDRLAPRRPLEVRCRWGLGPNVAQALLDLSEDGTRLLIDEPLPVGQEVNITFDGGRHPDPVTLLAVVVWCALQPGRGLQAGLRFTQPLDADVVEALTDA